MREIEFTKHAREIMEVLEVLRGKTLEVGCQKGGGWLLTLTNEFDDELLFGEGETYYDAFKNFWGKLPVLQKRNESLARLSYTRSWGKK